MSDTTLVLLGGETYQEIPISEVRIGDFASMIKGQGSEPFYEITSEPTNRGTDHFSADYCYRGGGRYDNGLFRVVNHDFYRKVQLAPTDGDPAEADFKIIDEMFRAAARANGLCALYEEVVDQVNARTSVPRLSKRQKLYTVTVTVRAPFDSFEDALGNWVSGALERAVDARDDDVKIASVYCEEQT